MQIKNLMKRKWMAIGTILLFVGVAIAPSINFHVVKASNDNDLVEVTSQACGIRGFGNTTVKLTKQQYQNLEQYLVGFRAKLNQTTTREEAVPIFTDAVVELNKYGLLPNGMSVEKAQRLVTGQLINQKWLDVIQNLLKRNHGGFFPNVNLCCLFYGSLNCCWILDILWRILYILPIPPGLYYMHPFYAFWVILANVLEYSQPFFVLCPIQFYSMPYHTRDGHVVTIGLLGIKKWDGNLIGDMDLAYFGECGVQGFTGISIYNENIGYRTLFGTAIYVAMHEYGQ